MEYADEYLKDYADEMRLKNLKKLLSSLRKIEKFTIKNIKKLEAKIKKQSVQKFVVKL